MKARIVKGGWFWLNVRREVGEIIDDQSEAWIAHREADGLVERIATVERLDGAPMVPGEDGLIHGDPLNLTDEDRAKLPPLPPLEPHQDDDVSTHTMVEGIASASDPETASAATATNPPTETAAVSPRPRGSAKPKATR